MRPRGPLVVGHRRPSLPPPGPSSSATHTTSALAVFPRAAGRGDAPARRACDCRRSGRTCRRSSRRGGRWRPPRRRAGTAVRRRVARRGSYGVPAEDPRDRGGAGAHEDQARSANVAPPRDWWGCSGSSRPRRCRRCLWHRAIARRGRGLPPRARVPQRLDRVRADRRRARLLRAGPASRSAGRPPAGSTRAHATPTRRGASRSTCSASRSPSRSPPSRAYRQVVP